MTELGLPECRLPHLKQLLHVMILIANFGNEYWLNTWNCDTSTIVLKESCFELALQAKQSKLLKVSPGWPHSEFVGRKAQEIAIKIQ